MYWENHHVLACCRRNNGIYEHPSNFIYTIFLDKVSRAVQRKALVIIFCKCWLCDFLENTSQAMCVLLLLTSTSACIILT